MTDLILTVEVVAGSGIEKAVADGTRLAVSLGLAIVKFQFNQYIIVECYGNGIVTRVDTEKKSRLMVWEEWNGKSWERRP